MRQRDWNEVEGENQRVDSRDYRRGISKGTVKVKLSSYSNLVYVSSSWTVYLVVDME